MLVTILVGVALVVVVFVALVARRSPAYRVERKLEIAAPAEVVFGVLDDLRQFAGVLVLFGSPLEERDHPMQKTFDGPAAGVGQSLAWSGKEAGKGRMTIERSVPGQSVGMKLELAEPMASMASVAFTLVGTATGSLVTWTMDGNHNFIGKALDTFMNMDRMLGADIEKGLARLKTVAEGRQSSRSTEPFSLP